MDILGIGPLEVFFVVLIALIVFGPKDMVKAGRSIGAFLRRVLTSPTWHFVQQVGREVQKLPTRLIQEASLEEIQRELSHEARNIGGEINDEFSQWQNDIAAWTTSPKTPKGQPSTFADSPPPPETE